MHYLENLTNVPDIKCSDVTTLYNWNEIKKHKSVIEAMTEVQDDFKKSDQCIVSYSTIKCLRNEQSYINLNERLLTIKISINVLQNILINGGCEKITNNKIGIDFHMTGNNIFCYIENHVSKILHHDLWGKKCQTIQELISGIKSVIKLLMELENLLVDLSSQNRDNFQRINLILNSTKDFPLNNSGLDIIKKFQDISENFVFRQHQSMIFCRSTIFGKFSPDFKNIVYIRDDNNITVIKPIYYQLQKTYLMVLLVETNFPQKFINEKIIIVQNGAPTAIGFVTMQTVITSKWNSKYYDYVASCDCKTNNLERKWLCNKCGEIIKVGERNCLYCNCGKTKKKYCKFQCFHENHGKFCYSVLKNRSLAALKASRISACVTCSCAQKTYFVSLCLHKNFKATCGK